MADTILRETQTKIWETNTQKPVEDGAITQEPETEMAQATKGNMVADTQEPLVDTSVT